MKFIVKIFKGSVPASEETHCVSITKTNQSELLWRKSQFVVRTVLNP
jgi:hypothetical protein